MSPSSVSISLHSFSLFSFFLLSNFQGYLSLTGQTDNLQFSPKIQNYPTVDYLYWQWCRYHPPHFAPFTLFFIGISNHYKDDDVIKNLGPSLRSLNVIESCYALSDTSLLHISRTCTNLEKLAIGGISMFCFSLLNLNSLSNNS